MALLDDLFKGNPLTGIAFGIGAYLLAPTIGPTLRPAAKAVIKAGILAYQSLAELGEVASDFAAKSSQNCWSPARAKSHLHPRLLLDEGHGAHPSRERKDYEAALKRL